MKQYPQSWRERANALFGKCARPEFPITHFNPACKHERTSHDIVTCAECVKYSEQFNNETTR